MYTHTVVVADQKEAGAGGGGSLIVPQGQGSGVGITVEISVDAVGLDEMTVQSEAFFVSEGNIYVIWFGPFGLFFDLFLLGPGPNNLSEMNLVNPWIIVMTLQLHQPLSVYNVHVTHCQDIQLTSINAQCRLQ
jgi:hypothetical protein